ncbi:hypothetical protein B0H66DRAFT_623965 [Apodospora peruviana]|uniref:Carbohydrate esterase family 16 protein n=1 Tax=Apodospora peruviana TaxID=516989 RepID=A0AAE0M639_9PEZI|nr:hypothetical protein B0H66DRAFT_623965 [Apodospora peruviana]
MLISSLILAGASVAAASGGRWQGKNAKFDTIVTFGDSYTDNGRLGYYINNGGKAPAPGTLHGESTTTSTGGLNWAQLVARNAGAKLVDYAVSGATCSNKIISRYFSAINRDFPSVATDEIPSFQVDVSYKSIFPNRTPDNTVYALWIGTNDLGNDAFLTDSQAPGTTITDYVDCVWSVFDSIYKTGGRRFMMLNLAPLQLSPQYAEVKNGGAVTSQFWPEKSRYNVTEYSYKMKEYTTNVNTMFEYGMPFQTAIKSRWPKASFDVLDVHALMTDIYNQPSKYLDAPYNVTGYASAPGAPGPKSGYMWYDELHPSEKTDTVIAKAFIDAITGTSAFGTHYE